MQPYDEAYYRMLRDGAERSALVVAPRVLDLVGPRSIVDVGCGTGTWLAVFRRMGVDEVLGIDGPHVAAGQLEIPPDRFLPADLTRPVRLDRRFDLVVSLEVAEHLPADSADVLVETLVGLAPVILFSAAVPFQGGEHHVNEQWPDYWAGRFARRGYEVFDCLRGQLWRNEDVEVWYRQNTMIYAEAAHLRAHPDLRRRLAGPHESPLAVVHPAKYRQVVADLHSQRAAAAEFWAQLQARDEELTALLGSRSWRATAPLRMVGSAVRALRARRGAGRVESGDGGSSNRRSR